jgi:serine/threonine protein kinase
MIDPRSSRFWQAAIESGLLDADALAACWSAIPESSRVLPEQADRRLANQAVESGMLTVWQAAQLISGRTNGYQVDRYILLDLLGKGGMGRVYLAQDSRLGRQVALKILAPERLSNPRAVARFQREARVGAQLQHENLVRIYDFGESSGRFYLVMEYIEGRSIGSVLAEHGPIPAATSARLLRQVARGLEHLHKKGLVHRDVNPFNIMVTSEGVAKLADMGLAVVTAGDAGRITHEGATVGTFDYVAPEQARDARSADIRSDIYSLGCTFYHMLTGVVPFPMPSLPEKLFAHQTRDPTPLDRLMPELPRGLVEIVRRMMKKSPDERFQTPAQISLALEPFTDEPAVAASDRAFDDSTRLEPWDGAWRSNEAELSRRESDVALAGAGVDWQRMGSDSEQAPGAGESAPILTPDDDPPVPTRTDNEVVLILDSGEFWSERTGKPVSQPDSNVHGAWPAWVQAIAWFGGFVMVVLAIVVAVIVNARMAREGPLN